MEYWVWGYVSGDRPVQVSIVAPDPASAVREAESRGIRVGTVEAGGQIVWQSRAPESPERSPTLPKKDAKVSRRYRVLGAALGCVVMAGLGYALSSASDYAIVGAFAAGALGVSFPLSMWADAAERRSKRPGDYHVIGTESVPMVPIIATILAAGLGFKVNDEVMSRLGAGGVIGLVTVVFGIVGLVMGLMVQPGGDPDRVANP